MEQSAVMTAYYCTQAVDRKSHTPQVNCGSAAHVFDPQYAHALDEDDQVGAYNFVSGFTDWRPRVALTIAY